MTTGSDSKTIKVYLNDAGEASIICSACGRAKKVPDASKFPSGKRFNARCTCGHEFKVSFERRKHYRKETSLRGTYTKDDPPASQGQIVVEDISLSGVGFKTLRDHNLKVDDIITVDFLLDDKNQSRLVRNVSIRSVHGRRVGSEFCDQETMDRELGFYLMA